MVYKIRRVHINGHGRVVHPAKTLNTYVTSDKLKLGGIYMLWPNQYHRVERVL